eukprot:757916-Hanusia_phi.AAC.1
MEEGRSGWELLKRIAGIRGYDAAAEGCEENRIWSVQPDCWSRRICRWQPFLRLKSSSTRS